MRTRWRSTVFVGVLGTLTACDAEQSMPTAPDAVEMRLSTAVDIPPEYSVNANISSPTTKVYGEPGWDVAARSSMIYTGNKATMQLRLAVDDNGQQRTSTLP